MLESFGFPEFEKDEIKKNIESNFQNLRVYIYDIIANNTDLYRAFSCIYCSFLGDSLGTF